MAEGFFSIVRQTLDEFDRARLVDGLLASEFFGESALGKEFIRTNGFSLVFQRVGMEMVCRRFPYLSPLLEVALFDACNAFYVNPLVLYANSRVDAHIDCRVMGPAEVRLIPNLVSVYYAEVAPAMQGGRLMLNTGAQNEFVVAPESGSLIHFLGSTVHRVETMSRAQRRISVVCEQYHLDDALLQEFPVCDVITSCSNQLRVNAA